MLAMLKINSLPFPNKICQKTRKKKRIKIDLEGQPTTPGVQIKPKNIGYYLNNYPWVKRFIVALRTLLIHDVSYLDNLYRVVRRNIPPLNICLIHYIIYLFVSYSVITFN